MPQWGYGAIRTQATLLPDNAGWATDGLQLQKQ